MCYFIPSFLKISRMAPLMLFNVLRYLWNRLIMYFGKFLHFLECFAKDYEKKTCCLKPSISFFSERNMYFVFVNEVIEKRFSAVIEGPFLVEVLCILTS